MIVYLTRSSWTKWYTFWPVMPVFIIDPITQDIAFECAMSMVPKGEAISRDIQFLEKLFPKLEIDRKGGVMKVEITEQEEGYFIRKVV